MTAAAQLCGLTPSAVSHQMQALARELGVALLEPVGRGVSPDHPLACRESVGLSEWDTGAALVARGFGVSLVPRLADLPARHRTRRIPISAPPAPIRRVVTAVRAGSRLQPAIAVGLEALRHVGATLEPSLDGASPRAG